MVPLILLADDDEAYEYLLSYALRKSGINASLRWAPDGQQAIAYLSRVAQPVEDGFDDSAPALVLLDLKMPRVNGFEVLAWRSQLVRMNAIPFVVLTSSELEKDKTRAAQLGATSYVIKPGTIEGIGEHL